MHIHSNAITTPRMRRAICESIERGRSIAAAARVAGCSWNTAYKWWERWKAGDRELLDHSSRPHSMPRRMSPFAELEIVRCRVVLKLGAHRLARAAGRAGSTIAKVLKRRGLHLLHQLPPQEPPNRYEYATPGAMLHVDTKKLMRFEQVGHRIHGDRRRQTRHVGWEAVHVAIDDHSRLAYVEVLPDETTASCVAFIERAQAFYAAHGVVIDRVMTDNGSGYKLKWRNALAALGMRAVYTRPYRPRTNGKAERFIQTLLREWAYGRPYATSRERRAALGAWLHSYNHHRPHGALANATPAERLPHNNLCGLLS
jgi:transposase InsO family protein